LEHLDWINDQLTIMAEAFGEKWTDERQEIYCAGLAEIQQERLEGAFRRARYELKWFPKLAELRELAGASADMSSDGRPGPEEAWARMPKGERMEDDSIVWCKEERVAYGACRSLLLEGDQIGARMAFKERYEKELAASRSQGTPVHWTISSGYDIEHRLCVLASAIEEKRIDLDYAQNFVPSERQEDFARMLPSSATKGLLAGRVEKSPDLPGLPGLLAKVKMQGLTPDELKQASGPQLIATTELTPEQRRKRREELMAQVEYLKHSRNGLGTPEK
jgi:hypothetical protein